MYQTSQPRAERKQARLNTASSPHFDAANNAAVARPHAIELDIEGSSVWVWPGADAAMVTAIIGALKAAK
jgi:hypothetical protein